MFENFKFNNITYSSNATLAIASTLFFLFVSALGEGISGSWGANPSCFKYLGCTSGFLGYDALEHFLFGIAITFILVWIFQKFPQYSILNTKRWKNILIILSAVVLISVFWEFLECAHDVFRVDILHQTLVNWTLNINLLDQPSNLDTVGDLAMSFFGSAFALLFIKF